MTQPYFTRSHFQQAADYIRHRASQQPAVGLILGSGLGGLAEAAEQAVTINSSEVLNWARGRSSSPTRPAASIRLSPPVTSC
jgi:purine nucleoside phosphorylase